MQIKSLLCVALSLALALVAAPDALAKQSRAKAPAKSKRAKAPARAKPKAAVHHARPVASGALGLRSNIALVIDNDSGRAVVAKNIHDVQPIASITKLMTALVVVEAQQAMSLRITITEDDIDVERGSRSRLPVGAEFSRSDLLHLALMSSENRAAHALARNHPGGLAGFVEAMNRKARELGMQQTRFADPTGLSSANVSTAADLVKLVHAANAVPLIRRYSTDAHHEVDINGTERRFHNTNRLVAADGWDIGLSKTGFINEAGRCLVMQARVAGRSLTFVLLDSWGKLSRVGDANRIRKWLTTSSGSRPAG